MASLDGRRILVTGAASGIGRAVAQVAAASGARVALTDVVEDRCRETAVTIRDAGGAAEAFIADISDDPSVSAMVTAATGYLGGIDGVAAVAGVATEPYVPVDEIPTEEFDRVMAINVRGVFLTAKYTVPHLRTGHYPVILLFASGAGVRGPSGMLPYGTSKGGVNGLGLVLAAHLADDTIRVNIICPGSIETPLKTGIMDKIERQRHGPDAAPADRTPLGTPDGVARVTAFLLSEDADYVRGQIFTR